MTNQVVVVKTEVPSMVKSEIDSSQYNLDVTGNSQYQPQNGQSFFTPSSVIDLILDYEDSDQEKSQDLPCEESMAPMPLNYFLPERLHGQCNIEPPVTMDSSYSLTQLNEQHPMFTNTSRIPQDGLFPNSTNVNTYYSGEHGDNMIFSSDIQHGTFNILRHSPYDLYEQSTQPSANLSQANNSAIDAVINVMPQFTILSMGDAQTGNQPLSMQIQSDQFQLQNNQFSPVSKKSNGTNETFCDLTNTRYLTLEVAIKVEVSANHSASSSDSSTAVIEDERRPKCFECVKYFSRPCYLAQHNKTYHSGDKPFKCFTCGKRFSDEQTRIEHEKRHKGDKPFKCTICPKMFQYNTDLKRHHNLHTGTKLHVCEVCKKGFIRRDHMVKHTYVHKKKNAL